MSGSWKPGDLALCVEVFKGDGPTRMVHGEPQHRPIKGLTYTVVDVRAAYDVFGRPGVALSLAEIPNGYGHAAGYNAEMFRKVKPRAVDAEDAETIKLLTGKPAKVLA